VAMPGDPGLPGVPPLVIQNGDVPLASLDPAGENPGPPGVIPASKPVNNLKVNGINRRKISIFRCLSVTLT